MISHFFSSSFQRASLQDKKASICIKKDAGLLMVNRAKDQNPAKADGQYFAPIQCSNSSDVSLDPIWLWN